MLKGVNQSMVNRFIAGGGVTCKCVGGNGVSGESTGNSANGNGINIGKIDIELIRYVKIVDNNAVFYVTKENMLEIATRLSKAYPTKCRIFCYDTQITSPEGGGIQSLRYLNEQEVTISNTDIKQNIASTLILDNIAVKIATRYTDGEPDNDDPCTIYTRSESDSDYSVITKVDSTDPILEGATEQKILFTFYYMEI